MDYSDKYIIHLQVPGQWPRNLVDIKYEIPVHIDECIFPHGTPVCTFSAKGFVDRQYRWLLIRDLLIHALRDIIKCSYITSQ